MRVRNLVISAIQEGGDSDLIWAQDNDIPNSGIRISLSNASTFSEGDVLSVTGTYSEEVSSPEDLAITSQINIIDNNITVTGNTTLSPTLLDISLTNDIMLQQYNSMLVQFQDVEIAGDLGFGKALINDKIRIDDFFFLYELGNYSSVSGIVFFTFGNYKIEARSSADLIP